MTNFLDGFMISLGLDGSGFEEGAKRMQDAEARMRVASEETATALKKNYDAAADAARSSAAAAVAAAEESKRAAADAAAAIGTSAQNAAEKEAAAASQRAAASASAAQAAQKAAAEAASALVKHVRADEDAQKKLQQQSDKTNKENAAGAKHVGEELGKLRNQVLGLFSAFEAGKGMESFIASTTQADAATGRLASRLNMSAEELSAQENAAARMGGTVEGVAQSFDALSAAQADWKLHGNSNMLALAQTLGNVQGAATVNFADPLEKTRENLLHNIHLLAQYDKARAESYGKQAGLSQSDIDLGINNSDQQRAQTLEKARKDSLTATDVAAAKARASTFAEIDQKISKTARTLLTDATPAIIGFSNALSGLLSDIEAWEQSDPDWDKPLVDFGKFLGSPEFKADVKEVKDDVIAVAGAANSAAQAVGGWSRVFEILIGLKLLGWLTALIGPVFSLGRGLWNIANGGKAAASGLQQTGNAANGFNTAGVRNSAGLLGLNLLTMIPELNRLQKEQDEHDKGVSVDSVARGGDLPTETISTAATPRLFSEDPLITEARKRFGGDKEGFERWQEAFRAKAKTESDKIGNETIGRGHVSYTDFSEKQGWFGAGGRFGRSLTDEEQKARDAEYNRVLATLPGAAKAATQAAAEKAPEEQGEGPSTEQQESALPAEDRATLVEAITSAPERSGMLTILRRIADLASSILDVIRGWGGGAAGADAGQPGAAAGASRTPPTTGSAQGASRAPSGRQSSPATPSEPAIEAVPPEGVVRSYGGNWEVRHNNFAGQRIPGVNAGPNSGGFKSFATPEDGVRSVAHLLKVYQDKHGLNTLEGIINRWAPPTDKNDTAGLIKRASQVTGFGANQKIDLHDTATMEKVVEAMIRGEQGGKLPVPKDVIHAALSGQPGGTKDEPRIAAAAATAAIAAAKAPSPRPGMDIPLSRRTASIAVPRKASGDMATEVKNDIGVAFHYLSDVFGKIKKAAAPIIASPALAAAAKPGLVSSITHNSSAASSSSTTTSSTSIGAIHVHTPSTEPQTHGQLVAQQIRDPDFASSANSAVVG